MLERLPDKIINPFVPENVGAASYDLRVGHQVYITPTPDVPSWERGSKGFDNHESIVIPSGQFAYLITLEKVCIPKNVLAFISFKFKTKASGLINVSGFNVDPGYTGKLVFATYNAGEDFNLQLGDKMFSIWFADLDHVDSKPYSKSGFNQITSDLLNKAAELETLPNLAHRVKELEKKADFPTVRFAAVLFIGAIILSIAARFLFFR